MKQIENILKKMSIKEKVAQINQPHYGWQIWFSDEKGDYHLTDDFKKYVTDNGGVGAIYGLFRTDPWTKKNFKNSFKDGDQLKIVKLVQNYICKNTNFKIGALIVEENPHGHQSIFSEIFPVNYTVGNSFDLELYGRVIDFQRQELFSKGINISLMSGLDISRDKRWGRTEECFSEDPLVVEKFCNTMVKEMQKKDYISVTAKHFIAYGASVGGRNGLNSPIGERELYDTYMSGFYGVNDAKVDSVMVAYNEIDGIPCISNKKLLQDFARKELGFEGIYMADGFSIDALINNLGVSPEKAATLAFEAGINLSLWDKSYLLISKLVEDGTLSESKLDELVYKVLELKKKHNLLDFDESSLERKSIDKIIGKELNTQLAIASTVLLKNENSFLPFIKPKKLLVIGNELDDIYEMTGDYSPFMNEGDSYLSCFEKLNSEGFTYQIVSYDEYLTNPKIENDFETTICFIGGNSKRDFQTEFESNGAAKSSKSWKMTSGEGVDLISLDLPKIQKKVIKNLNSQNLLIVCNMAKPHVITDAVLKAKSVLKLSYPGQRGGTALYKILLGQATPSGRLAYTLPRYLGINDISYLSKNKNSAHKYWTFDENEALFEFGHGLNFENSMEVLVIDKKIDQNKVELKILLKNSGERETCEVIQIYESAYNMYLTPFNKRLKYFEKIKLNPQEKKEIKIDLPINIFKEFNYNLKPDLIDKNIKLEINLSSKKNIETINLELKKTKILF